jgi:hypothetical protein
MNDLFCPPCQREAAALEAYARQANDMELERQVHDIRVRAERRTGELLREMPKATGGQPYQSKSATGSNQYQKAEVQSSPTTAPKPRPLADLGISKDQSSLWQKLAEVPEDEFEAEVANPVSMPTAASIVSSTSANHTLSVAQRRCAARTACASNRKS